MSATGSGRSVVVLGAQGFIGSHVVAALTMAGHRVLAVTAGDPWRIEGEQNCVRVPLPDGQWWTESGARAVNDLWPDADAAILLGYAPPPDRETASWTRHEADINVRGTIRLARGAAEHGVRIVFSSSADVYGLWREGAVSETDSPRPETPYGHAKLAVEEELRALAPSSVVVRIATSYGAGERHHRAIPRFIEAYLRGGRPTLHAGGRDVRDYVHVRDVARVLCYAAVADDPPPILNAGSGQPRTTREVAAAVAAAVGVPLMYEDVDSPRPETRLLLNIERIVFLGLKPTVSFGPGLEEEVRWLRSQMALDLP